MVSHGAPYEVGPIVRYSTDPLTLFSEPLFLKEGRRRVGSVSSRGPPAGVPR